MDLINRNNSTLYYNDKSFISFIVNLNLVHFYAGMRSALEIALLNAQVHVCAVLLLLLSNGAVGLSGGIVHRLMAAGRHIRDGNQRDECHNKWQQNEEPRDIRVAVFAQGA